MQLLNSIASWWMKQRMHQIELFMKYPHEVQDECFVIATGGVSHVYKPLTEKIHIADRLHTLKGLYYLGKDL